MQKQEKGPLGMFGNISRVEHRFRWNLYLPEIANDQDGHRQGAERHGIANRVNEIQPIEKMLLRAKGHTKDPIYMEIENLHLFDTLINFRGAHCNFTFHALKGSDI